jgi:inorganic phosphate transporter, PiT family
VLVFLLLAVLTLAFANGANDNFKGVATLFGSGRLAYRPALAWATVTTVAGSVTAIVLGSHLAATFSGRGIVPESLVGDPGFVLAVAVGASGTVLIATWRGLPVSTTHALLGALGGAGLVLAGGALSLGHLGAVALLPLLLSPLVACVGTYTLYRVLRATRRRLGIRKESCVCIDESTASLALDGLRYTAVTLERPPIVMHRKGCRARNTGHVVGIDAQLVLDGTHFASAGAVSFARGLNDTPKIVALLTAGAVLGVEHAVVWVAVVMAVGGLLAARRVARTMSQKITPMNDGQGLTANLVTAALVLLASPAGMPVSTTHVSVGALFGIGAATGGGQKKATLQILLAWLVTLPMAALLAALTAYGVGIG